MLCSSTLGAAGSLWPVHLALLLHSSRFCYGELLPVGQGLALLTHTIISCLFCFRSLGVRVAAKLLYFRNDY